MYISLESLELIDKALNAYRETAQQESGEIVEGLEALQNYIREEWREIKERQAWEEYHAYFEEKKISTIKEYFKS